MASKLGADHGIGQANMKIVLPDEPQIEVQAAARITCAGGCSLPSKCPVTLELAVDATQEQQFVEVENCRGVLLRFNVLIGHQCAFLRSVPKWHNGSSVLIDVSDALPWRWARGS